MTNTVHLHNIYKQSTYIHKILSKRSKSCKNEESTKFKFMNVSQENTQYLILVSSVKNPESHSVADKKWLWNKILSKQVACLQAIQQYIYVRNMYKVPES